MSIRTHMYIVSVLRGVTAKKNKRENTWQRRAHYIHTYIDNPAVAMIGSIDARLKRTNSLKGTERSGASVILTNCVKKESVCSTDPKEVGADRVPSLRVFLPVGASSAPLASQPRGGTLRQGGIAIRDRMSRRFKVRKKNSTVKSGGLGMVIRKEGIHNVGPVSGAADRPRGSPLRRLKKGMKTKGGKNWRLEITEGPKDTVRFRNHKRGLRSPWAVVLRRLKRIDRTRFARRKSRREKTERKDTPSRVRKDSVATAQEGGRGKREGRIGFGCLLRIGTLNLRGITTQWKWEEVEAWMKHKGIGILALQETHQDVNFKACRKEFSWLFSSEGKTANTQRTEAGVGFVMNNKLIHTLADVVALSDRIMSCTFAQATTITLITAYAPQAMRPEEEKETFYQQLDDAFKGASKKGPTWVLGDFNARVQEKVFAEDEGIVGPFTFQRDIVDIESKQQEVIQNRQDLIGYCTKNSLRLENTFKQKTDRKLVTYREVDTPVGAPFKRGMHEQLDCIIGTQRWKNAIKNIESDCTANINSDHYPVWAETKIKFAANKERRDTPGFKQQRLMRKKDLTQP